MPAAWRRRVVRVGVVVLRPSVLLPLWALAVGLSRSVAVFFAGWVAALVVRLWLRARIRPAEVFVDDGGLVLYSPGVLTRAATVPWPRWRTRTTCAPSARGLANRSATGCSARVSSGRTWW